MPGDEECYSVFAEPSDLVTVVRQGYDYKGKKQATNRSTSQLSKIDLDPEGNHVLTTRVRDFSLPPNI